MQRQRILWIGLVVTALSGQVMAAGQAKNFRAFCGANNQLYINLDQVNENSQPPIVERVMLNQHLVTCVGSAFVSHGKALNTQDLGYAALQSAGMVNASSSPQ